VRWRRAAAHGHGDATHTGVMFRPVPVASSLSPVLGGQIEAAA
jgi:hypothetical protein